MTKPIDNLQAWRVFIKTAQTGSVSQAAASLRMEISTASRLIQGIEREFGSLFEHAKRPLLVNSRGRSLLRTLEPLIDHFDNLQSLSRFASERPVIRISAPIALANKFIYRYIFDYRRINPNVQFKLFSQQNLTELIGNTVDIALLRRPNPSPDLIILPFVTWGGFPVASPQYLALNGEPATPGDLARHIGILHRGGEYPITTTLLKGNQRSDLIKWERVYVFDDQGIILNAVMENIGISLDLSATQYLTADGDNERILAEIQKDLKIEVEAFEKRGKLLEAQRLKQRTEYDMEMIREIGYCKGIENYSRYLSGKKEGETPDTLLEYFPKDFLIFIDESHISIPQIRGMYNGDRARKTALVENGFRLKAALDNRPLKFEEFRKIADQSVFVSATPGDFEIEVSHGHIAEQLIRPTGILDPVIEVRSTKNQVDDLLEEIRIRADRKERVLVTTLTKKMAEELTEYYLGFGVRVKYMHSDIDTLERIDIIKGLRKGEFDALVGINLLREGLDIPEVSLVAILEADKEGFLRSRRSLVQTIGRAARNIEGRVILYGDIMTDSMKQAIDETNRRRKIQNEYNVYNNIDPKTIVKEISEDLINLDYGLDINETEDKAKKTFTSRKDIEKEIIKLQKQIAKLSKELDFENAIIKRDEMTKLKKLLLDF